MKQTDSKPRPYNKKNGISTRDSIIDRAREIINHTGVVDFRIEALATSLALSPGNITYHFPKKEDIIFAIWEQYYQDIVFDTTQMITPLLDIKQLFLYYRSMALRALKYIGVASYFHGDMGVLIRESERNIAQLANIRQITSSSYDILIKNGYMNPFPSDELRELAFESQFIIIRWWANHAILRQSPDHISTMVDQYISLSIHPLTPYLTPQGKDQLQSIQNAIN